MSDFVWTDELASTAIRDELDRRHPERLELRGTDVPALQRAFDVVEEMWSSTVERAKRLPEALLHERVEGEYSFLETFRHLLFAWEAWIPQIIRPGRGYHAWALPPDLPADAPHAVLWSAETGWSPCEDPPGLDAMLDVRATGLAGVRRHLSDATSEDLASPGAPPPWYPQGASVLFCYRVVLNEEWWHHRYAIRDLAVLERGSDDR